MSNSDETLARLSQLERNYLELAQQFEELKQKHDVNDLERAELEALVKKAQAQLKELDNARKSD